MTTPSGGIAKLIQPPASAGKSTTSDLYGLGPWGAKPVQPGSLFGSLLVNSASSFTQTGKDNSTTADDVMAAFAHADPQTVAQVQRMLVLAGFYSSSSYNPTPGIIRPEDLSAFAQAVKAAAVTGQDLSAYLQTSAQQGEVQGSIALAQKNQVQVTLPDQASVQAALTAAFQSHLGRDPSAKDIAAFTQAYQKALLDNAEQKVKVSGPAVGIDSTLAMSGQDQPRGHVPTGAATRNDADSMAPPGQPSSLDGVMAYLQEHDQLKVSPTNWKQWATQAGLGQNAPDTPGNEEYVARYKLGQYYRTFGSWGAAVVAWSGGPAAASGFTSDPTNPRYAKYAQQADQAMQAIQNQNAPPFLYSSPIQPQATVTTQQAAPTLSGQADQYATSNYGGEAQQYDEASYMDAALSFLGRAG